jgi:hypothetical protein
MRVVIGIVGQSIVEVGVAELVLIGNAVGLVLGILAA